MWNKIDTPTPDRVLIDLTIKTKYRLIWTLNLSLSQTNPSCTNV
jgi:hypothetical protein